MMRNHALAIVATVLLAGCSSAASLAPSPAASPSPAILTLGPCPSSGVVDILQVSERSSTDRLSCFWTRTITFRAWIRIPLEGGAIGEVYLQPVAREGDGDAPSFVDGLLDPALGTPQLYRWFNVTGHFRDPATACPSGPPDVGEPLCDQLYFVVTGLEPTTAP
jgi:hypothetical protein